MFVVAKTFTRDALKALRELRAHQVCGEMSGAKGFFVCRGERASEGFAFLDRLEADVLAGIAQQVVKCRETRRIEEAVARRQAAIAAERAEVERREREEEARREAERRRRAVLVAEAEAYRRVAEIRAYVGAVRVQAEALGEAAVPRITEWATWALGVAAEMDPLAGRIGAGVDGP